MPESPRPFPQPQPQPQPPVSLPKNIGGYEIQRIIGSGGMATVYAALQKQPRRTVALKVMKVSLQETRSENALRRFKREVEILGKLNHPFIAQVFDAGMHDDGSGGMPFFVMEFISNARTILEHVAAKDMDVREKLKLFVKVCAAVEHGHRNKIIHRDLKPGNILIDAAGDPKVIDFGVARSAELDVSHQTVHTDAGRIVGTLQYMSPEQVDTTRVDLDARCDVYALGVLLYKLLTGRMPHDLQALPIYEAARIIREEDATPPSQFNPDVRGDLETIILKSLERDRTRRYTNAGSLGRDIVRFLADKPIHARRAGLVYRTRLFARRQRTALIASAVVIFILAAAATIVLMERSGRDDLPPAWANREDSTLPPPPPAGPSAASSQPPTSPESNLRQPILLADQVGPILSLAFSPDATFVAAGSRDHTLAVWRMAGHTQAFKKRDCAAPVTALCFNRDGSRIAAATHEGRVLVLDARTGELEHTLNPGTGALHCVALSPDGTLLACAGEDFTLRIIEIATGRSATIRSSSGAFACCAFSPDGKQLVAGTTRGSVYVCEGKAPAIKHRLSVLTSHILAVAFLPDGSVAAASDDGGALMWHGDLDEPQVHTIAPAGQHVIAAAFDHANRILAVADATDVRLIDLSDSNRPNRVVRSDRAPTSLALSSDLLWCALGDDEGNIHLLPVEPAPEQ